MKHHVAQSANVEHAMGGFSAAQRFPDFTPIVDQVIEPFDALAPIRPAPGSLNTNYHYIGAYGQPHD